MQKSFRKHNLKLAIFLSYREAIEGGGFTITDDIFNEILKTYKKNNIIFILLNDKNVINLTVFNWVCLLEDFGKPKWPAVAPSHLRNE